MFRKLFSIMKGDHPLLNASDGFTEMLELSESMILEACAVYWGKEQTPEERTALYEKDVRVNKLEREIRKSVVTHLSSAVVTDVPFGLLLMSLVKDVERMGDYAKNLVEIADTTGLKGDKRRLPDDDIVGELKQISKSVCTLASEAAKVYAQSDRERARELTKEGRTVSRRCDKLVTKIAGSDYDAALAVDLTLSTRFHKRIQGHLLNLLSSVLMPLHKLDYYDEKAMGED